MATRNGGPNEGANGTDEPVSGHGATMIGSPALAGLSSLVEEQFSVRGADGQVEGPMATDALIGAIRAGRYTGEESVSRDGRFWIPIMAIPDLGEAFRTSEVASGATLYGGAPITLPNDPPGPDDAELGVLSDDGLEALDLPAGGGTLAMELPEALGAAVRSAPAPGGSTVHFDLDDLLPSEDAPADLLDLDAPTGADAPFSESLILPSPKGFTSFSDAPLELLDAAAQPKDPTVELPLPKGFTHLGEVNDDVVHALGLEVEDLPRPVAERSDPLTASADNLPRSAGGLTNLPTPAASLPRGAMTLVPDSA